MSNLPESWEQLPLGTLSAKTRNLDPSKFPEELFELYSVPSFANGTPDIVLGKEIKSAKQLVQPGDVLLCKIVPHINRVWVVKPSTTHRQIASGEWIVHRSENHEPDYLRYLLSAPDFRAPFLETVSGVGGSLMRARPAAVEKIEIPIAPALEQRRIVAKLDSLSVRSSSARHELDRIPILIARYKQAILAKAFSGELIKVQASFQTTPISTFVAQLDQGWSPRCETFPRASSEKWAVIKTTAIQPVHFYENENKQLPANLEPRSGIEVKSGDVLITRAGPRSRVGISCVVRQTRPRLMLADKIYRLRVKPELADPVFLALMLNAPQALELLETMKTGISDSGLNLTQDKFLGLPMPLIGLKEQRNIVRLIEASFAWLDKVATEHTRAEHLVPKLDQAILAKAFRGELVPQDPNDEPAMEMLARIQAASTAETSVKLGRTHKPTNVSK